MPRRRRTCARCGATWAATQPGSCGWRDDERRQRRRARGQQRGLPGVRGDPGRRDVLRAGVADGRRGCCNLKASLKKRGLNTAVGDQGGAADLEANEAALQALSSRASRPPATRQRKNLRDRARPGRLEDLQGASPSWPGRTATGRRSPPEQPRRPLPDPLDRGRGIDQGGAETP